MANFSTLLKSEIARIARKEVRSETEHLKKTTAQQRAVIADLRRNVADLQKQVKVLERVARSKTGEPQHTVPDESTHRRFSATRLAAHRVKLGISAAAYGKLVGMSGATIYLWETGKSRPNPEQLARLVRVRTLARKQVMELLAVEG